MICHRVNALISDHIADCSSIPEIHHLLKLFWMYIDEQMIKLERSCGNEHEISCLQTHKQLRLTSTERDHRVLVYLSEEIREPRENNEVQKIWVSAFSFEEYRLI